MRFDPDARVRPKLDTVLTRQLLSPMLVGRDHEMAELGSALGKAKAGQGSLALMLGEAGVGKSRLAREIKALAGQGDCLVLSGRASEQRSPLPFRPLAEALFSAFRATGPPETNELEPFRSALGHLVPEWRQDDVCRSDDFIVLLGEAILRLLGVVAGSGAACLIVLEDLHWADPDTLTILEYLADNLAEVPVLCVGTLRAEENTSAFHLSSSLAARRAALVIEVGRLDATETQEMARSCLDATSLPIGLAEALWTGTEGVPFLVEELLAAWVGSGALRASSGSWSLHAGAERVIPVNFAQTVRRRVEALGADARPVISAAAAIGRSFDVSLLPRLTGLNEPTVLSVLRRAIAAQLLSEPVANGNCFRFRHALTRDAILGDLLAPERRELFGQALRVVEASHPGLPGDWCERAADLAEGAGCGERAARLLLESGRRALAQGALPTAEAALQRARALKAGDSELAAGLDETLLEVLAFSAKTDQAVEAGVRLLANYVVLSEANAARRATVHLRLARALVPSGDWPAVDEHLGHARHLAEGAGQVNLLPAIDALTAHAALGELRLDEAGALAQAALGAAEAGHLPEVACEALEVLGRRARLRDLHEAEVCFERARQIAERHGLMMWRIRALHELALLDMLIRIRPDRLQEVRDLAYRAGALATAANLDLHIATVLVFHFDAEDGLAAAQRCAKTAHLLRLAPLLPMALVREAECHAVAGARDEMERALAGALTHGRGDPAVSAGAWGQCRALYSLLAENRQRAISQLDCAMDFVRDRPGSIPWVFRGLWVLLHAIEDHQAEATQAEFEASGVTSRPIHRALLGYATAVTLGRRGHGDAALKAFSAAQAEMVVAGGGGPGQLAYRLVAEAALDDDWGEPAPLLHEAIAFFDRSGHVRVASKCRLLVRRAGGPVPRQHRRGTQPVPARLASLGVTQREVEVLVLVAERLGTREIAGRLFLSPRTVHKHMQHLIAKTGLHQREQLADLAASLGLSQD